MHRAKGMETFDQNILTMSSNLSPREQEVLRLILDEQSNASIARLLRISERTVESHRKNIYLKTDTNNIVGLVKHSLSQNQE